MTLTKHKLGEFTELYNERCGNPNLTVYDISGVNADKEFFEPSKQAGVDTRNYKNVPPDYFACNLMHVGRDKVLPIALNHSGKTKVVSPAYTIFRLKEGTPLLREYFFMMLKSKERDRYFWFHTDSSVRDGMSWDDFCDLEIDIPPVSIQQKYVDVYNAMLANRQSYECGLEDLKLVCDAYIEELRREMPSQKIGTFLELSEERNDDGKYGLDDVRGVSIEKKFIPTKADMKGVNLRPYYTIKPREFAYVPVTSRNGEKISIALNTSEDTYICSSSYIVFSVQRQERLWPAYLQMYFERGEFNRYARFNSWGSARETFNFDDMCDVAIPIPDIKVQKAISDIYAVYVDRKEINDHLKERIKSMCPILIKGSLEEAEA
ncbi:restriction endonuclease subunit S [Bifidobacterium boum]|uniref:restriction endonuclease subunit S n=1 Tax=Bifidobacterium boum TaxID=78343 RepID=UPI003F8F47C4